MTRVHVPRLILASSTFLAPALALAAEPADPEAPTATTTSAETVEPQAEPEPAPAPEAAEPEPAPEPEPEPEPAPEAEAAEPPPPPPDRGEIKWIKRWAPERNTVDIGVMFGLFFPGDQLDLYEPVSNLPDDGAKDFRTVAGLIGGRVGYFPLRWLGVEVEGALMPTTVESSEASEDGSFPDVEAVVWRAGGMVIGQLPWHSVTPFVGLGAQAIGVTSRRRAVGNDVDAAFHFGAGLKIFANRQASVRLEFRDTIGRGRDGGASNSFEILAGVSFTIGREPPKPPPPAPTDTDGDGVMDPDDDCLQQVGTVENRGCPIADTDSDGIPDLDDKCIEEAGVEQNEGCPMPDTDGDGLDDGVDACIDKPGTAEYDGCPIPDTDDDGLNDKFDKCPEEPETSNAFEDTDGCPDEVPAEVKAITGVVAGIVFSPNSTKLSTASKKTLDFAAETMTKHPSTTFRVVAHADEREASKSETLTQERADAIKAYLVKKGIDEKRLSTRGAQANEPLESNKTSKGRAANRRVEMKLGK